MTPFDQTEASGYVRLYRKLTQNPVWTNCTAATFRVFIACLVLANWKDRQWVNGETIVRGSFVTSRASLAKYCRVSQQQVRDALTTLGRLNIVSTFGVLKGTNRHTTVTVINYDSYQYYGSNEEPSKEPRGNQEGTKREPQRSKERREEGELRERKPLSLRSDEESSGFLPGIDEIPPSSVAPPKPKSKVKTSDRSSWPDWQWAGWADLCRKHPKRIYGADKAKVEYLARVNTPERVAWIARAIDADVNGMNGSRMTRFDDWLVSRLTILETELTVEEAIALSDCDHNPHEIDYPVFEPRKRSDD